MIDEKQITQLALSGLTFSQIEAVIRRELTTDEREQVRRAQAVTKLKRISKRTTAASGADRKAKHVAKHSAVTWRTLSKKRTAERAELETDPEEWLRFFMPEAYFRPFGKLHKQLIAKAVEASRTGGRICIAGERGIGKSSIMWGLVLYLKLSGEQIFPVCVPWDSSALKRALKFWKNALCFNTRLRQYYPEFCAPFAHSKGVSQRLQATTWTGAKCPPEKDGEATGCQIALTDGLIVMPDSRGCIGGASVNGNPRGLNHSTPDGRILRPSLILLDDVQDRDVAKSERLIRQTVETIDGDVGGMGDAAAAVPLLMCGNCIEHGDVMAHYLKADNWQALKIPCVAKFPDGWDDGDGPAADLWREWNSRLVNDDKAAEYFDENRAAMVAGFVLNSPDTYTLSADVPEPVCAVMSQYFKMGHDAFMAEKQQEPIRRTLTLYDLEPSTVTGKTNKDLAPLTVPDWAEYVVAATDVNPSYALSTVVLAFSSEQRAAVVWYGTHKLKADRKTMTDSQLRAYVMAELEKHETFVAGMSSRPGLWVIDGLGTPAGTVMSFAAGSTKRTGIQTLTAYGRGSTQYNPRSGGSAGRRLIPYEQCHRVFESRSQQWLLVNADYWREQAQRGWLGAWSAPGSLEICKGNHREFADQICREKLETKADGGTRMLWVWRTLPGEHDFGDCMMMGFAGAAVLGIGTGGKTKGAPRVKKPKRQARQIAV